MAKIDAPANVDGVNLLPHLSGEKSTPPHESLYWRFGSQKAIRRGPWKLVDWRDFEAKKSSGWQLFNLAEDIGEQRDQASTQPSSSQSCGASWEKWNAGNIAPVWHGTPNEDPTAPARPTKKK